MEHENILSDETIILIETFIKMSYHDKLIFLGDYSGNVNDFIKNVVHYIYPLLLNIYGKDYLDNIGITQDTNYVSLYYNENLINILMDNADTVLNDDVSAYYDIITMHTLMKNVDNILKTI